MLAAIVRQALGAALFFIFMPLRIGTIALDMVREAIRVTRGVILSQVKLKIFGANDLANMTRKLHDANIQIISGAIFKEMAI